MEPRNEYFVNGTTEQVAQTLRLLINVISVANRPYFFQTPKLSHTAKL